MPKGRGNPKHRTLPLVVGRNLTALELAQRWRLSGVLKKLYDLRIIADYVPVVDVQEPETRIALGLMRQAFWILRNTL